MQISSFLFCPCLLIEFVTSLLVYLLTDLIVLSSWDNIE